MSASIAKHPLGDTSAGMIGRIQAGDGSSWMDFHQRCHAVICEWCRWNRVSDVDTEDLSQETMLVVVSKIASFRHSGRGSLRAWLRAIAWRCWCDAISRPVRLDVAQLRERFESVTDEISELEAEYERLEQLDILQRAMAAVRVRVEPRTWEAFWMSAMQNRSGQESGASLGMSADSVHSARARVQRMISVEVRRLTSRRASELGQGTVRDGL
jgi:RNA polymerase sigma-70 factor (ECF subfamily)